MNVDDLNALYPWLAPSSEPRRCPLCRAAIIIGFLAHDGHSLTADDVDARDDLTVCEREACAWGYRGGCFIDGLGDLGAIGTGIALAG